MANIILKIGKDVELAAEEVLHAVALGQSDVAKYTPGALSALAVLAVGVEKAVADIAADQANPLGGIITVPQQLADFIAVWPELKALLLAIGVKL